jgi:hypothetical protein
MKVYVAQIDIPYEDSYGFTYESPYQLGIFSSLEKAKERCEVEVDDISQESDYEAVWCLE